jgi:NTF2-like protein (DUF6841)
MTKGLPIRSYAFFGLAMSCLILFPQISIGQSSAEFKDSDKAAVERLFDSYMRAYSMKDYAGLRDCLQAPFVRFPAGWEIMGTLDEVMPYYRNQRDALDKDNYDHSKFIRSRMTVLSGDRALVDRVYRRYRKDGSLLSEAAAVYVVCKSSGSWKVCGTFGHEVKEFGKTY